MANTTVNIDIQVQSKSIAELENQLAEVNDELKQLPVGSEGFNKLSKEAQELTVELDKANEAAEGLTDDKKFLAAEGSIKILGGSLAGVVGVLGTLGVESEAFGDLERKAASAIAVAVGVRDVAEGMRQLRESTVLATAATKLFGNVSRKALIATGIGAFVVALGTIVAYWDDITAAITGSSKATRDLTQDTEQYVTLSNEEVGILERQKQLIELQGGDVGVINEQLREELILQNDKLELLLQQLEAELEIEKTEQRRVTFGEAFLAFAKDKLGIESAALGLAKAGQEDDEANLEKEQKINEIRGQILDNRIKLAQVDKEEDERKEERGPVEMVGLELQAQGLAKVGDATQALIESTDIKTKTDELAVSQLQKNIKAQKAAAAAEELKQQVTERGVAALGALSMALGQGTAAGKAAAIAEIAITTGIGFAKALEIAQKSAAGTGPAAAFAFPVFYASQLAAVLGAVGQAKEILSGVKGGPATPVSIVGGAPAAAAPGGVPQGGVANLEASAPQFVDTTPTVQAYVLSGNVTSAQEADAKLSTRRNIG